jgi:hydroxyacylglutathione hydrolase
MILHKIKSQIVSHLSYFIGSGNEAIVVDPMRDCDTYIDLSMKEGMNIKYIFETHRNEDYVIGSKELSSLTGAEINHGQWPDFEYGKVAKDGDQFKFGKLKATVLYTPGHTPGCISIAVTDLATSNHPILVCAGDTLFVNDVGRTDFGGPSNRKKWSENLYESIHNKLLPLGDHVVICPAHGSGSVCGGGIANRELSTLGMERLTNPLLQLSKEEFVQTKIEEHHEYAPYFKKMEVYNVKGAPYLGAGHKPSAFNAIEFKKKIDEGAIVIDTRPPPSFGAGHIKGSYNASLKRLGLIGWVLPYNKPLLLVTGDRNHVDNVTRNLARIGYDNIEGYLTPSIGSWYQATMPVERLDMITVSELKDRLAKERDLRVLDVRSKDEWEEGHIKSAFNIYVGLLEKRTDGVPKNKPIAVICKSGTRSSFASSILLKAGYSKITNVLGGMDAWKKAGYEMIK